MVVAQCSHIVLSLSSQYYIPTELLYLECWMLMRKLEGSLQMETYQETESYSDQTSIMLTFISAHSSSMFTDGPGTQDKNKKKKRKKEESRGILFCRIMHTCLG
jgi:hypothetical protein